MTNEDFLKLKNEWQQILKLNNWTIKAVLVDKVSDNTCGRCISDYIHRCAKIEVLKEMPKDRVIDLEIEEVLIHEMLHCKFMNFTFSSDSIEGCFYDEKQHQLLEDMADALYDAKYKLKGGVK